MPRKKNQEKKECPETPLIFNQIHRNVSHMFWQGEITPAAMKVYMFHDLHCNVSTGKGHRISKQYILDHVEISPRSLYYALAELQELGLLKIRDHGDHIADIPHRGLINQVSKAMWYDRQNREFYSALQARLDEVIKGHITPSVRRDTVQREYTKLVNDRKAEKLYVPKKVDDVHAVLQKLEQYATEAEGSIEEDLPWDDDEAVTV